MGMALVLYPAELGSKLSVFKNVMADIGMNRALNKACRPFQSLTCGYCEYYRCAASPDILSFNR